MTISDKDHPRIEVPKIAPQIISLFDSSSQKEGYLFLSLLKTDLGDLYLGATENGLCLIEYADTGRLESALKSILKYHKLDLKLKSHPHIESAVKQLIEYFDGKRTNFSVKLQLIGTPFQKRVWQELLNIPYGQTRSYLQQATSLNHPKAVRAVAGTNRLNKISIIVPCHRVIGKNGKLVGYGGGLHRKEWLLDLEKKV